MTIEEYERCYMRHSPIERRRAQLAFDRLVFACFLGPLDPAPNVPDEYPSDEDEQQFEQELDEDARADPEAAWKQRWGSPAS